MNSAALAESYDTVEKSVVHTKSKNVKFCYTKITDLNWKDHI